MTMRMGTIDLAGIDYMRFADVQPFGVMFIDIENLKGINHRYGHIVGDRVIERISASLKVMVRSSDGACRHEGDEFLFILPNTSSEAALCRAKISGRVKLALQSQRRSCA